jgi:putative cell wall-binding protein
MRSFLPILLVVLALGGMWCAVSSQEHQAVPVEVIRLTDENFDATAPRGKEADAIVGDLVIRNRFLTATIAQPIATRNANMTVFPFASLSFL